MDNNRTIEEILGTLNTEFGLIREEAWFVNLKKTALSKNITTADWNALLWQVASTVNGADALKKALTGIVNVYDSNLTALENRIDGVKNSATTNATDIKDLKSDLTDSNTRDTTAYKIAALKIQADDTASNVKTNATNLNNHITDVFGALNAQSQRIYEMAYSSRLVFNNTTLEMYVELYDANGKFMNKSSSIYLPKQSSLADFYIENGNLVLKTTDGKTVDIPVSELLPTLTTSLDVDDASVAMSAATGSLIKEAIKTAVQDRVTTSELHDAVTKINRTLDEVSNDIKGAPGDSAYDVAVKNGYEGDVDQWLESLKGTDGTDGIGIEGPIGPRGISISGITYVSSSTVDGATVDEYAITFDDVTVPSTTFYVTNGKDGADGTSLKHRWVGDKLEIESDSGVTLSDSLKGVGINGITPGKVVDGRQRNYLLNLTEGDPLSFYVLDGLAGAGISKIELVETTVGTDGRTVRTYKCILNDEYDSIAGTFKVYDGATGPAGPAFSVAKIYKTVDEMRNDYGNEDVPINAFVVVSEYTFDDGVGGALFIKGTSSFEYVLRFTGIQGPPGINGTNGTNGTDGKDGIDGVSVSDANIDNKGILYLTLSNGTKLTCGKVVGDDGSTPSISADGYWIVGSIKTRVKAKGEDGADGHTPVIKIAADGEWLIDGVRQGVNAIGVNGNDGVTPYINSNGYWVVNGTPTSYKAIGTDGAPGKRGADGMSVTHSWDGTSLVVTSASGTSKKDLKGASAYEIAQKSGYKGTEQEWVDSLNKDTKNILTTDGDLLQVFVGTKEEYDNLPSHDNLFAIVTDDPNIVKLNELADTVANILDGSTKVLKSAQSEYALRAVSDVHGNKIYDSYATKKELEDVAANKELTVIKFSSLPLKYNSYSKKYYVNLDTILPKGKTYKDILMVSGDLVNSGSKILCSFSQIIRYSESNSYAKMLRNPVYTALSVDENDYITSWNISYFQTQMSVNSIQWNFASPYHISGSGDTIAGPEGISLSYIADATIVVT